MVKTTKNYPTIGTYPTVNKLVWSPPVLHYSRLNGFWEVNIHTWFSPLMGLTHKSSLMVNNQQWLPVESSLFSFLIKIVCFFLNTRRLAVFCTCTKHKSRVCHSIASLQSLKGCTSARVFYLQAEDIGAFKTIVLIWKQIKVVLIKKMNFTILKLWNIRQFAIGFSFFK